MRKLVTIRTIDNILPIQNADAIEQLVIGGGFRAGELICYLASRNVGKSWTEKMINLDFKGLEERCAALYDISNESLKGLKKFQQVYSYDIKYLRYNFPTTKLLQSKSKQSRMVRVKIKQL